ncbi:hypothetical protein [Sporisorium scitamineum]|uniref:G-patch domain-containing protein n=1 Tax=Sporisorium scitamineum TaxID=49012 RepID=A0A0F7S5P9_9BASI|nr:hypothetical protein [Sporisorium scitamineum]
MSSSESMLIVSFSLSVACTLPCQHEHDAPSSQGWPIPSPSSSTSQSRGYVDRDDPRYVSSRQDDWRHRDQFRRRSRSPEGARRETPSLHIAAPHRNHTVAWKDLRTPLRVDQGDGTPEACSSKLSTQKIATTATNKRFAHDISRWNRKQSELQSSSTNASTAASADPKQCAEPPRRQAESDSSTAKELSDAELLSYDYKDRERIACLLCQRKFKSLDTLHRHEAESQLHKDNLASIDVCRNAVAKLLESRLDHSDVNVAPPQDSDPSTAPTYRDRASERRAVFGAETPCKHTDDSRTKVFGAPAATTVTLSNRVEAAPQSAPEKPIDSDNIGSRLLAMMGWSQGQGLGAQREGRTEIIETKMYKPGAGLGSSGAESVTQTGKGPAWSIAPNIAPDSG